MSACRRMVLSFLRVLQYCAISPLLRECLITGTRVRSLHVLFCYVVCVCTIDHQSCLWLACSSKAQHSSRYICCAEDPKQCARLNSALDWYHGNVRLNAAGLTWHRVIGKTMKAPVSEGQAKHFVAGMKSTFQVRAFHCVGYCIWQSVGMLQFMNTKQCAPWYAFYSASQNWNHTSLLARTISD